MWFNNLKMKQKIISSFILVSLFVGIVGGIGVLNMGKINSNSSLMYNDDLEILKDLQQVNSNSLHGRLLIINLVESRDFNKVKETQDELSKYREQNNKMLKEYEEHGLNSTEKGIYAQFQKDLKDYREASGNVINLVSNQKYDDAMVASKKSAAIRDKLTTSLDKLIQITDDEASNRNKSNNKLYKNSFYVVGAASIFGLIIAIILGFIIASVISNRIRQVLVFAEAVGNGDLTKSININSKDEIGSLAESLNKAVNGVRNLISQITYSAGEISASSEELSATTQEISSKMDLVNRSTEQIAKGAQDLSTVTEKVSVSTQEIDETTNKLAK